MDNYSLFDIIGPVMLGPSSSHTAGAAKIGLFARRLVRANILNVKFNLHGSFYKTGYGHRTQLALVGGILGLQPDNLNIRKAFKKANEMGLSYSFDQKDLGDVHPNSVELVITTHSETIKIIGSSIGAGKIKIQSINDIPVKLSAAHPALILKHKDKPGVLALILSVLTSTRVNIISNDTNRNIRGESAYTVIELEKCITKFLIEYLAKLESVYNVTYFPGLKEVVL